MRAFAEPATMPRVGAGPPASASERVMEACVDDDLDAMNRDELVTEVKRLRAGIRTHRDSTGHDLCWHHPDLWGLLPEKVAPAVAVPPWPVFLRGCLRYREALERELPDAPVADHEHE
jgi:hypothetical protein